MADPKPLKGYSTLADAAPKVGQRIATGIAPLDLALSCTLRDAGFPCGRVNEIYGEEHVGKTTLGVRLLLSALQGGGHAVLCDTEGTFTLERARQLCLDPNRITYIEEQSIESIFDKVVDIAHRSKRPSLFFLDTLAACVTNAEMGRRVGESAIASLARASSLVLRRSAEAVTGSELAVVVCNQLKVGGIGVYAATERDTEATAGGKAIKFHAHTRLRLLYGKKFRMPLSGSAKSALYGDVIKAMVTKDKDGPSNVPGRNCTLIIRKVGKNAGTFSVGLSCAYTLEQWKSIPKIQHAIAFDGKKYPVAAWETLYQKDAGLQDAVHHALEEAQRALLGMSFDDTEEEEMLEL